MKKQPLNNRQYIIGILVMLGLMFVQYTFAAEFKFDAIGPALFTPIFKAIDDNIVYAVTLAGGGAAAITPGDLRTRAGHFLLGVFCSTGAWELTKKVTGITIT